MKTQIIIISILFTSTWCTETNELSELRYASGFASGYASGKNFTSKFDSQYFVRSIGKFDQFYLINGSKTEARLKSVAENNLIIETKSGKIITPEKGYFKKVVSKNGNLLYSRPNLENSVALLEGALNQSSRLPHHSGIQRTIPNQQQVEPVEVLPYVRFGLMLASLGAGVYSAVNYQKGDDIYTGKYQSEESANNAKKYERQIKSHDEKAGIAFGISGGLLLMGLISFAF